MGAIFALNAAALYVLHSGRAENAAGRHHCARDDLVWLVLDGGEGLINSIEDGGPPDSSRQCRSDAHALRVAGEREEIEEVCAA